MDGRLRDHDRARPRGRVDRGRRSPTLEILGVLLLVFVAQWLGPVVGIGVESFALSWPLGERPWTLVTSVYAHIGPGHLVVNAVGLLVVGLVIERSTTRWRYHAFVLLTGAVAGVAEVVVAGLAFGASPLVLGISGAVFGLMGYLLAANPVSAVVLGRFRPGRRAQVVLVVLIAGAITLLTAADGAALVAHFAGLAIGLVAGRNRLLRVR